MNTAYIGYALIVIAIVFAIISLIPKSERKKSSSRKKSKVEGDDSYVSMPNTYNLQLPKPIEKMSTSQIKEIARKIFTSYKAFDYKHASMKKLEEKEWHTWQVSILLMIFKKSDDFIIYDQEDVFNKFFLNASENDIKSLMRDIIRKYEKYVDTFQLKDSLCKEYIWSNKEISVIFYFLANYKKYIN